MSEIYKNAIFISWKGWNLTCSQTGSLEEFVVKLRLILNRRVQTTDGPGEFCLVNQTCFWSLEDKHQTTPPICFELKGLITVRKNNITLNNPRHYFCQKIRVKTRVLRARKQLSTCLEVGYLFCKNKKN